MSRPIVVTRHPALVQYLQERGIIGEDAEVKAHVSEEDVKGRDVIGILPLHLAALARSVTVVPLQVPPELRGQELTIDQVRELAGEPRMFVVHEVKTQEES